MGWFCVEAYLYLRLEILQNKLPLITYLFCKLKIEPLYFLISLCNQVPITFLNINNSLFHLNFKFRDQLFEDYLKLLFAAKLIMRCLQKVLLSNFIVKYVMFNWFLIIWLYLLFTILALGHIGLVCILFLSLTFGATYQCLWIKKLILRFRMVLVERCSFWVCIFVFNLLT